MDSSSLDINHPDQPSPKVQIVGWPPVRSHRKNNVVVQTKNSSNNCDITSGMYVKVSMDGAPYRRKIDLRFYKSYQDLLKALENMFKHPIDVPLDMFINSCKRLRIMKGCEAKGLGCL
ncbi:unnamed protein product [Withania somnifera]